MKIRQILAVLIPAAALMLTFGIPANCKTQDKRIILMRCCQQDDGSDVQSEAVFLDEDGCVWQYQSDSSLPETDKKRLEFLSKCKDAKLVRQLKENRIYELESLIEVMGDPQLEEQPCEETYDCGIDTYSAIRYGEKNSGELFTLAVTGSEVVENLDPNAYALYTAFYTEVMGYDLEEDIDCPIKPMNIRSIPIAEFLGVEEDVFEGELTAGIQDCEAGYIDLELDEDETREKLEWLSRLAVTGKRNALCVTGNTDVYKLSSSEGDILAKFEFYNGLLVTGDGMYAVETLEV